MTGQMGIAPAASQLGILTRELHVRLLNYSPSGCLLETSARIDTSVTASLRMVIDGDEYSDDVQVVRCQHVEGAGSLYQVGVRFLWNVPPSRRALRQGLWQLRGQGEDS